MHEFKVHKEQTICHGIMNDVMKLRCQVVFDVRVWVVHSYGKHILTIYSLRISLHLLPQ